MRLGVTKRRKNLDLSPRDLTNKIINASFKKKITHIKKDFPYRGSKGDCVQIVVASNKDGYEGVSMLLVTSLKLVKICVMTQGALITCSQLNRTFILFS